MRNLKKLLAVVVAICVLATFTVPAFAEDSAIYANADQAQKLYDMGLYAGISTTSFVPDLGSKLTREQGMVLLLKLFGKLDAANAMTDEEVTAALAAYTDADKLSSWAKKAMAYVVKNGISAGTSATTVGAKDTFTGNQFATLILKQAGYTVADWTKAAEELAAKGVTGATALATTQLTRDDLVGIAFGALSVQNSAGKTIIEALVDAGKVTAAAAEAAGVYTGTVTATVTATGAKILTVTFNKAVDTAKASFEVKKGNIAVNKSTVTFSDDKKVATITLVSKMTEGDYTVITSGLTATALSGKVTVTNEKIANIDFVTNTAVIDRADATNQTVAVSYKVYNQYTEDITSNNPTLTITTGRGNVASYNKGTLKINDGVTAFKADDKLAVSILDAATGTFESAALTVVAKGSVADIQVVKLYNADAKTLAADSTPGDFKLLMLFKDQYGNAISTTADIKNDVIFTISDPTKFGVVGGTANPTLVAEKVEDTDYVTLALANGSGANLQAGTASLTVISKTTGKLAKFDVVVKEVSKVDQFSMSAPDVAPIGEKVEIPFTAVDQFGTAITKASVLNAGFKTLASSAGTVAFEQDYVKNTAKMILNATAIAAKTNVTITALTNTDKLVTLTISLTEAKVPSVISGTKDFTANLAKTATADLKKANIVVKDQYNRDITPTLGNGAYVFKVESSDAAKVSITTSAYIQADAGVLTLNGLAKGSSTITITLMKWVDTATNPGVIDAAEVTEVNGGSYSFSSKVAEKADIASYELADFSKLYEISAGTWDVDVTVNGILADGSKVVVPKSYYTVTENDAQLSYVAGTNKLASVAGRAWGDDTEKAVPVVVTVAGDATASVLTKNVTVCKTAPEITTYELVTNGVATKEGDGVISVALGDLDNAVELGTAVANAVKTVDQYGKEVADTAANFTIIVTNVTDSHTITGVNGAGAKTVVAGDTFSVTVVSTNGKVVATFKVIIK